MIDFACKRFSLDEVVKCGLSLTKSDYETFSFFMKHESTWYDTNDLAKQLKCNLSTIQRAVKKLSENGVIMRRQKNLDGGGYIFMYKCSGKLQIRNIVMEIVHNWTETVEKELKKW